MMKLRAITAGIAAASLALTPVAAAAQSADRAGTVMQETSNQDDEGASELLIFMAIAVVVIIGFSVLIHEENSTSP